MPGGAGAASLLTPRTRHRSCAPAHEEPLANLHPDDRGYGIDFGFRDPFGNHIRISQMADGDRKG